MHVRVISLDNIKNDTVYAYANRKEFDHFLKLGISFETLTPPSLVNLSSFLKKSGSLKDWDVYPSYTEYVTLMNDFATARFMR